MPSSSKSKPRRSWGEGAIDSRSDTIHRLRWVVDGHRFSKTVKGTYIAARTWERYEGKHIAPDKLTVARWIEAWLSSP
jgi:hypothetical protein